MFDRLAEFLKKEYPGSMQPGDDKTSLEFRIEGVTVTLFIHEFDVSIFIPRGTPSTVIGHVGDRFDEALKTGAYDDLFLPF
jgi:hypothetical protein